MKRPGALVQEVAAELLRRLMAGPVTMKYFVGELGVSPGTGYRALRQLQETRVGVEEHRRGIRGGVGGHSVHFKLTPEGRARVLEALAAPVSSVVEVDPGAGHWAAIELLRRRR